MTAPSAIRVQGLRARLGGRQVLHGVDLDVRTGDLYGLLGRNGAGKTTTLRCVLGYLPAEGGECEVFGTSSRRLHEVSRALGVALDPPGMDDTLTVRENLVAARVRGGLRGGRGVDEALALVGLAHRANNRGDRLSHGQSRRAAVARALLGAPELLVLDEPLSGLDPEGVEEMLDLFRMLTREHGVTVVLSSHHLREVQHVCGRIGIVDDGRTLLEGEVDRLLQEAGDGLTVRCRDLDAGQRLLAVQPGVMPGLRRDADALHVRVDAGFDPELALRALVKGGAGVLEYRRERADLVHVFRAALAVSAGPGGGAAA